MNERQWLTSKNLRAMLEFLQIQGHVRLALVDRKLLYWIAGTLKEHYNDRAANLVEGYAEGRYDVQGLRQHADFYAIPGGVGRHLHRSVPQAAQQLVQSLGLMPAHGYWDHATRQWIEGVSEDLSERPIAYLRELFGNLWATPNPDWRTFAGGVVLRLLEEIEQAGAWDLMPILGDALEDAGCAHRDVLDHCRSTGWHRKGCWVLDLIRMND